MPSYDVLLKATLSEGPKMAGDAYDRVFTKIICVDATNAVAAIVLASEQFQQEMASTSHIGGQNPE